MVRYSLNITYNYDNLLCPGFYTGSTYDIVGYYHEKINTSTLTIKTHQVEDAEIRPFNKAIILIRDPYSALLAEFNRRMQEQGTFTGHAKEEDFK